MKSLVAGWFSFEQMGATAGDLLARDLVCEWLDEAGRSYDVAVAPPFEGEVNWKDANPDAYDEVVFVCGPFGKGPPLIEFLDRFAGCRLIGVDVSMLQSLDEWNPFDVLVERDSSRSSRPDVTFLSRARSVPLVGRIQVHHQAEYGDRALHQEVDEVIDRLLASLEVAVIRVDTRLDENAVGLRTPREVESVIAGMDTVVTTRLHGAVLALKNGVPPLVIDPIAGGAKLTRQMETIGWRWYFAADMLEPEALRRALDFCLTPEARAEARKCAEAAIRGAEQAHKRFIDELSRWR